MEKTDQQSSAHPILQAYKMSDCEYESAEEDVEEFNIYNKIISKKNEKTYLIHLPFRELLNFSDSWSYNRKIVQEKADELYDTLCESYDIPWTLHAIYDRSIKNSFRRILILDGQHRKKAIERYIETHDIDMTCDHKVWVWVYELENSETTQSNIATSLFKKINNNRQFEETELPNTFVIDLVKQICAEKTFTRGIKKSDANSTSHSPYLHRKELNTLLNEHIDYVSGMSFSQIITNMQVINHKLSMKTYEELYGKRITPPLVNKLKKAISIKFYLNLGKSSKYPIQTWIKYINDVDNFR